MPKTFPARLAAEPTSSCACCSIWLVRFSAEMCQPSRFANRTNVRTMSGAAAISCFVPEITAGITSATRMMHAMKTPRKIRPVALPRRHPREASQLTAGSIANERKNAVNRIPITLDSFDVRSVMSITPQIPAMRTRTPRIVTCRRNHGIHGGADA